MKALLSVLAILGCMTVCGHAQCSTNGITFTWVDRLVDTNASSLLDPDGSPLGFVLENLPGTDDPNPEFPCIQVDFPSCTGIRYMTVAVETTQQTCVRRFNEDEEPTCGSSRLEHCVSNVANTTQLDFFCDSSCAQNDVPFYYRVVLNCTSADDEFFCNNVNIAYPSSLQQTPSPLTVDPNPMTNPGSGSPPLSSFVLASLLLMTLLALVFTH